MTSRRGGRPERHFNEAEIADMLAIRKAGGSILQLANKYHAGWNYIRGALSGYAKESYPKMCRSVNCDRKGQILAVSEFWGNNSTHDGLDQFCIHCRKKYRATREGADTRVVRRDGPPYEFECPVCGMGIDLKGHAFTDYKQALACCVGRGVEVNRVGKYCPGRPRAYDQCRVTGLLQRVLRG